MTTESGTYKFEPVHGQQMDQKLRVLKEVKSIINDSLIKLSDLGEHSQEHSEDFDLTNIYEGLDAWITYISRAIADEEDKLNDRT